MNDSLWDLLDDAVDADARRLDGDAFAVAHGASVATRIRHRRTVRSVGVGSIAAVSAGAVAFGATQFPWGGTLALGSGECPPGTVAVTAQAPYPMEFVPVDDNVIVSHALWMPHDDLTYTIHFGDGTPERVVIQVRPEAVVQVVDGVEIELSEMDNGNYYAESPEGHGVEFTVERDPQGDQAGEIRVGTVQNADRDLGDQSDPAASPTGGSVTCVTPSPEPSPTPSAAVAPVPTADPSPEASTMPGIGSSPYQCGFEFLRDEYGTDEWAVLEAGWLSTDDAAAMVADHPQVPPGIELPEGDSLVPFLRSNGGLLSGPGGSGSGSGQISWVDPGDPQRGGLAEAPMRGEYRSSESANFVVAIDGVVVGHIDEDTGEALMPDFFADVAWDERSTGPELPGMEAYLFDESIVSACAGFEGDLAQADIYAVSGAGMWTSTGELLGPVYAWRKLERP
jgi:hypothetical protein